jgi:phage terminase large subunit-like protein
MGAWQRYALYQILRHDRAGDLIARIALLSTARQNGKSVIVRALYGWMLDEGQELAPFAHWTTLLAAAHDAKQARITYANVLRDLMARREKRRAVRTSMYQGITAGRLDFDIVTGQPGSARGWSAGAIAWDEMLTQRDWTMYEALSPTQSAQRSPIMVMTSTAGLEDSLLLRSLYDRLVRLASGAEAPDPTFYGAWWQSENAEAGLDWAQLAQANPGMRDRRLTRRGMRSEHGIMPPDSWRRERLNHWIDRRSDAAVSPQLWGACRTPRPLEGVAGPFALGIDVSGGGARATIAVAGIRPDGRIGVEVHRDLRADATAIITSDRIIAEVHAFADPLAYVAYDSVIGAASAFDRDGQATAIPWDGLKPAAMMAAAMDFDEMITAGRLAVDDPLLDAQVPMVGKLHIGSEGGFRYSRRASEAAIDAFLAAMLAAHAIAYTVRLPQIY